MKLAIIETPYAGRGSNWLFRLIDRWENIRFARAALRHSLLLGEAPLASHLLYTQRGVLRDAVPAERQHGIDAGLAWGQQAALSVVYLDRGITRGMEYGIQAARQHGREITYRKLDDHKTTWQTTKSWFKGIAPFARRLTE
jgi:hypothetical protein